jgi:hypothetical protein
MPYHSYRLVQPNSVEVLTPNALQIVEFWSDNRIYALIESHQHVQLDRSLTEAVRPRFAGNIGQVSKGVNTTK